MRYRGNNIWPDERKCVPFWMTHTQHTQSIWSLLTKPGCFWLGRFGNWAARKQALDELKPRKVGLCDVSLECRLRVCVRHDICCPSRQAGPEQVHAGCRVPRQTSRAASEYLWTSTFTQTNRYPFTCYPRTSMLQNQTSGIAISSSEEKKNKINMRIKMCSISVEKKKQNCNTILPSVQWQCITQRLDANLHASDVPSTSSGDFKGDQYKPQLEYGLWVASMYMPLLLWKPRPLISRM